MISLNKRQLHILNMHTGGINADTGLVFVGVRGAHNPRTGLFEVEVDERPVVEGEQREIFSLNEIIADKD